MPCWWLIFAPAFGPEQLRFVRDESGKVIKIVIGPAGQGREIKRID